MTRLLCLLFTITLFTLPPGLTKASNSQMQITDEATFLSEIINKPLTRLGVKLVVKGDGTIEGRAFGSNVTGRWSWENGFFCRSLQAGKTTLERDCQTVTKDGKALIFQANKGTGDAARLWID